MCYKLRDLTLAKDMVKKPSREVSSQEDSTFCVESACEDFLLLIQPKENVIFEIFL